MRRIALVVLAVVVLLGSTLAGSGGALAQTDPYEAQAVVVTFETADGSTFRTVFEQPADIAAVEAALAGDGYADIPIGTLAYGPGGVNAPHAWHMQDTTLAEITIELCDGTASMVDEDLVYWVDTVGQFCPWSATVVAVEPLGPTDPGEQIRELIARLIALLREILDDL